jgi:hypothetical protein
LSKTIISGLWKLAKDKQQIENSLSVRKFCVSDNNRQRSLAKGKPMPSNEWGICSFLSLRSESHTRELARNLTGKLGNERFGLDKLST